MQRISDSKQPLALGRSGEETDFECCRQFGSMLTAFFALREVPGPMLPQYEPCNEELRTG